MERDRDTALYVISVAAELAGVHPQTLRLYERKGLLDPARTRGGTRRYSDADLEQLRHIGELTAAGVGLEGVRRILDLERQLAVLRDDLDRIRQRLVEAEKHQQATSGRALVPYRPDAARWPAPRPAPKRHAMSERLVTTTQRKEVDDRGARKRSRGARGGTG